MRERQTGETIKLRLMALVLALALTWYTMNPAPGSINGIKRDGEQPDEKHRDKKSPAPVRYVSGETETVASKSTVNPSMENIEDLEWPEVIDIG